MTEKIKLLYVVSSLGSTGPTTQLLNLIKFLDKKKFSASVLTLSPESKDTKLSEFIDLGICVKSLNLSRFASIFFGRKHLISSIRELGPTILHTQGLRADMLACRISDPLIRIATQRNNPFEDYPMLYGRLRGSVFAYLHYRSLQKFPYVVSCSKSLNNRLHLASHKSLVVQNGIDLTLGQHLLTKGQKSIYREALGISDRERIFVASGPLVRRKSLETIIDAFLNLHGDNYSRLFILGEGPQLGILKRRAGTARNIEFIGHLSDINPYLRIADGLISASISEGLPNIVLEGLAWGLPMILSDISAHREILQTDTPAGVLFPPNNSQSLAEIIETFERDYFDQDASREIVVSNFNAKSMSRNYQHLYDSFTQAQL